MPTRPPRRCGCGALVSSGRCKACAAAWGRAHPGRAALYDGKWQKASREFLALPGNDVCKLCGKPGANAVDHRIAHRGDLTLFWNRNNWQASHVTCNSRKAATVDRAARAGR